MVGSLANHLKVPLDSIHCHIRQISIITGQRDAVSLAPIDRPKNIGYPVDISPTHRGTASFIAVADTPSRRSPTGTTSISSRPNNARISSNNPDALIRRFPSTGSMSTRMSMSLPSCASPPLATDPNSFGFVARYLANSTSNSRRCVSMTLRRSRFGTVGVLMPPIVPRQRREISPRRPTRPRPAAGPYANGYPPRAGRRCHRRAPWKGR